MRKTNSDRKHPVRASAGVSRVKTRGKGHWFDHPEMQARIAKAEQDRSEGRVQSFESRDAALAYFDSLS